MWCFNQWGVLWKKQKQGWMKGLGNVCEWRGLGCSVRLNGPGGLHWMITFDEGFEGGEEVSCVNIWKQIIPGSQNSKALVGWGVCLILATQLFPTE